MPDYIQLLESKLTPGQKRALNAVTDIARARSAPVFLTGGAVRAIISGASIRDIDITVQTNPFKFKKDLGKAGFTVAGEHEKSQTLYLRFGDSVKMEVAAARMEDFPKPARPEYRPAGILGDLRRRDFTANAMALSLNEGSWGLLLDPLNGTADISARQLRLANNYGFLDDPIRLVRATRLLSRTGWEMEERTKERYDNAKAEGVIDAIQPAQRGYELEEIAYEEEPLQVMKALEAEGWMSHLSSTWSSRSADAQGIERLHQRLVQLLMAGLQPDPSSAQFRLLTAKLAAPALSALKRLFIRTDLIESAATLDRNAKKVLQQIVSKDAARPSRLWKLLHEANPEAVLWLHFTGKSAAIQNRFENFFTKWPEARQKIPNALLQEMRIVPGVSGYDELLDKLTFALMDAELPDEAAIRKFAEPYSPPAPPPTVIVRRSRASKKAVQPKGAKAKGKKAQKSEAGTGGDLDVAASAEIKSSTGKQPEVTKGSVGRTSTVPGAAPSTSGKGAKPSAESPTAPAKPKAPATAKKAKAEASTAKREPATAPAAKGKSGRPAPRRAGPVQAKAKPPKKVMKKAAKSPAKGTSRATAKSSPHAGKSAGKSSQVSGKKSAKVSVKPASKAAPKRSARKNGSDHLPKRGKAAIADRTKKTDRHKSGGKGNGPQKTKAPSKKRSGK